MSAIITKRVEEECGFIRTGQVVSLAQSRDWPISDEGQFHGYARTLSYDSAHP